jgi:hypothetical protein
MGLQGIAGGIGKWVQRYVPAALRNPSLAKDPDDDNIPERLSAKEIDRRFGEAWRKHAGQPSAGLGRVYLRMARKWRLYGSTIRRAEVVGTERSVWVAAFDTAVELLDETSLEPLEHVGYQDIRNFGGSVLPMCCAQLRSREGACLLYSVLVWGYACCAQPRSREGLCMPELPFLDWVGSAGWLLSDLFCFTCNACRLNWEPKRWL